ncbi:MAG: hypothetical protein JXL97_14845 [Bacteroidales bacterium]|nr:hypothetical protein [Bacteroidales bacterium]
MKLFNDKYLKELFDDNFSKIEEHLDNYTSHQLLNTDYEQFVFYLTNEFSIEIPIVDFNNIQIEEGERIVKSRDNDPQYHGHPYKIHEFKFYIPYSGDYPILTYQPLSGRKLNFEEYSIERNHLTFKTSGRNAAEIESFSDTTINSFKDNYYSLISDLEIYNNTELKTKIQQLLDNKLEFIRKQKEISASLKYKTKSESILHIPLISKPNRIFPIKYLDEISFEPKLSDNESKKLISTIYNFGKNLEGYEVNYKNKTEPDLRLLYVTHLKSIFIDVNISPETFYQAGKTDIFIEFQNKPIYIAECKNWTTNNTASLAVDQLFQRYLNKNISTVSIIIFNRNKNFNNTIETILSDLEHHDNFIRFVDTQYKTWLNFLFRNPFDESEKINLSVLVFHYPK